MHACRDLVGWRLDLSWWGFAVGASFLFFKKLCFEGSDILAYVLSEAGEQATDQVRFRPADISHAFDDLRCMSLPSRAWYSVDKVGLTNGANTVGQLEIIQSN